MEPTEESTSSISDGDYSEDRSSKANTSSGSEASLGGAGSPPQYTISYGSVDTLSLASPDRKVCQVCIHFPHRHCSECERSIELTLTTKLTKETLSFEDKKYGCTMRPAKLPDMKDIEKLRRSETRRMFGEPNLYHNIESSYIQLLMSDDSNGEVIAFIAVVDYPNPTYLSETGWEEWMDTKYMTEMYTSQNSVFLHFFVWNKKYKGLNFMEKLINGIFTDEPYLEYILYVLPPNGDLGYPYDEVFCPHWTTNESIVTCQLSFQKQRRDLFMASRSQLGPNVTLFGEHKLITNETCNQILGAINKRRCAKKWLKYIFGGSKQHRTIITGLCTDKNTVDIGMMSLTKKVDIHQLHQEFETFPFYTLRASTKYDTWTQIFDGRKELQCLVQHNLEESKKLLVDPITQKRIESEKVKKLPGLTEQELHKCRYPHGFDLERKTCFINENNINIDGEDTSESEDEVELKRKELAKEDSLENYHDLFKVVGRNIRMKAAERITQPIPGDGSSVELHQPKDLSSVSLKSALYKEMRETCTCKGRIHYLPKEFTLEFYGDNLAMEVEFYDPPANQQQMLFLRYLLKSFSEVPRTYILLKVPNDVGINPMLRYFHKVEKKSKFRLSKKVLYLSHKLAICGKFDVREMCFADFEKLMAMSWNNPYRKLIERDILNVFLQKNLKAWLANPTNSFKEFLTLEYRCFVFTASDLPVGFAVVKREENMEFYKTHYHVEHYTRVTCHPADAHGFVRHLFVSPLFRQHTRLYLRGVMKACRWATLLAFTTPCRLQQLSGCSVVQELSEWVAVRPKMMAEAWGGRDWEQRAVHLLTYSMSARKKDFFGCYLVIVGSGDLAMSFLEHLLYSRFNASYGFRHLTLIANDGMESSFPGSYSEAVDMMRPWNGRYDRNHRDKCNLENWVTIVKKEMVGIDREKRCVHVEGGDTFHFDYLFLFCGTQFSMPQKRNQQDKKLNRENEEKPMNVFTVNSYYEAYTSLSRILQGEKTVDGEFVVYGNCVEAFSCVGGLLEAGVKGRKISLFICEEGYRNSVSYIHSRQVMEGVCRTMKDCGVSLYKDSTFLKWDKVVRKGETHVCYAYFKSGPSSVSCKVAAFYSFQDKAVKRNTYQACHKSGLYFEKRLLIDSDFRTSDENIYAGGSMTAYSSIYKTEGFNHEFYNSVEIGAEIAQRFWEGMVSSGNEKKEEDDADSLSRLVGFTSPLVICARLAGNWHYVRITAPGNRVMSLKDRSLQFKMLQTGNAKDGDGPGLFQLLLDGYGIVRELTCYRRKKILVKDLINVYGKHESLLNNLLCRFDGRLINNLFNFFSEPWSLIIYNEQFIIFCEKLHCIYFRKRRLFSNETSFYDFVAYALNLEKWNQVSRDDEVFMEDLFCYNPDLKHSIEEDLINFIEKNEDFLISKLKMENELKYKSTFSKSRLLSDLRKEMGLPEIMPQPVQEVVPTVKEFRHLDGIPLADRKQTINFGSRTNLETLVQMGPQERQQYFKKNLQSKGIPDEMSKEMSTEVTPNFYPEEGSTSEEIKTNEEISIVEEEVEINEEFNKKEECSMNEEFHISEEFSMREELNIEETFNINTELYIGGELNICEEFNITDDISRDDDYTVSLFPELPEAEGKPFNLDIKLDNMEYEKDIDKKLNQFQTNMKSVVEEDKC